MRKSLFTGLVLALLSFTALAQDNPPPTDAPPQPPKAEDVKPPKDVRRIPDATRDTPQPQLPPATNERAEPPTEPTAKPHAPRRRLPPATTTAPKPPAGIGLEPSTAGAKARCEELAERETAIRLALDHVKPFGEALKKLPEAIRARDVMSYLRPSLGSNDTDTATGSIRRSAPLARVRVADLEIIMRGILATELGRSTSALAFNGCEVKKGGS